MMPTFRGCQGGSAATTVELALVPRIVTLPPTWVAPAPTTPAMMSVAPTATGVPTGRPVRLAASLMSGSVVIGGSRSGTSRLQGCTPASSKSSSLQALAVMSNGT